METPIRTPDQLAKVLRGYRKSRQITQKEVAGLVGLLPKSVSGLESSPEKSQVVSLFKLLSALELELVLRPKKFSNPNPDAINSTSEW
ncbi:MAG: transcriptional regulator [Gammaproteobacteria bacterium]